MIWFSWRWQNGREELVDDGMSPVTGLMRRKPLIHVETQDAEWRNQGEWSGAASNLYNLPGGVPRYGDVKDFCLCAPEHWAEAQFMLDAYWHGEALECRQSIIAWGHLRSGAYPPFGATALAGHLNRALEIPNPWRHIVYPPIPRKWQTVDKDGNMKPCDAAGRMVVFEDYRYVVREQEGE